MEPVINSNIFVEPRLARINWYQAPTLDDLIDALLAIQANPAFSGSPGLLIIDHGTDFMLPGIAEVQQWIARAAEHLRRFKACAMTVTRERHFDLAKSFSACAGERGITLRAFRDELAAGKWLLST